MKTKHRLISLLLILTLAVTVAFSTTATAFGATSKASKYWVKVNAQANVVTVYKRVNKQWKPYRAMLCSTGTGKKGSSNATPTGTYRVKGRWDWGAMVGNVYARYVVQFYGDYLFHSVPYEEYRNPKSMPAKEFNKLGKDASHGCVRLSLMDAKWVYNNIPRGTKVTIYNSKNPGPLGKPSGIKLPKKPKLTWDPTDTNKKNKKYKLPKPVITVSSKKKLTVLQGSSYKLKSGVTAQDPNTFQNLTSLLTVSKVRKYSKTKKEYIESNFSTKNLGTYKITYKVNYKYGGTTYKTIKIKVVKRLSTPKVTSANDATNGLVTLTWKPVKHASKYVVYRSLSKEGTYRKMYTTTKTTYTNTYRAVPGKTYFYKVKAITAKMPYTDSKFSAVVTGTPVMIPSADTTVVEAEAL